MSECTRDGREQAWYPIHDGIDGWEGSTVPFYPCSFTKDPGKVHSVRSGLTLHSFNTSSKMDADLIKFKINLSDRVGEGSGFLYLYPVVSGLDYRIDVFIFK